MVKRLVTVIGIAYLWFALGFSTYAQGNEISQISVKMPEVKVYLNQSIEGNEEIRAFLSEKELFYQNVESVEKEELTKVLGEALELLTEKPRAGPTSRATFAQQACICPKKAPGFGVKPGAGCAIHQGSLQGSIPPLLHNLWVCHRGAQAIVHRGYGYSIWWTHAK